MSRNAVSWRPIAVVLAGLCAPAIADADGTDKHTPTIRKATIRKVIA